MDVGVRELKLRLSEYLARVREGETVVVTHRGRPVAKIERLPPREPPEAIRHLVEAGHVIYKPLSGRLPPPLPPLPGDKTFSQYVAEERR